MEFEFDKYETPSKETKAFLDVLEDLKNGKRNAADKLAQYVDNGRISADEYDDLIKRYGVSVKDKKAKLEKYLTVMGYVLLAACFLFLVLAPYLAEDVFVQTKRITETVQEPYTHVISTVNTYVCYTTTYGSCYHADYCGSLWNSRYRTTVYEAKKSGYTDCSKCTPYEQTIYKITETRYRDKDVTKYEEYIPRKEVYITGFASIFATWFLATLPARIKMKKIEKQG